MLQPFERYEGVQFDESVIALSSLSKEDKGIYDFLGSGFIIAPFIAVTAKHVIDGFISKFYGEQATIPLWHYIVPESGRFHLYAWQGNENQLLARKFTIDFISLSVFSDFAVLRLVPLFKEANYIWRPYSLAARNPRIGDEVIAYGYNVKAFVDTDGVEKYKSQRNYSVGTVKLIHEYYRDVSSLRFPCFETDARYDGGMSGGPVFTGSRHVIGLISASMVLEKTEEFPEVKHYSHAATIWPLLSNSIETIVSSVACYNVQFSIQQLAKLGIVSFYDHDKFLLEYSDGKQWRIKNLKKDRS